MWKKNQIQDSFAKNASLIIFTLEIIHQTMVFNSQKKASSRSVPAAKPSAPDPYAVPGFEGYGKHCFAGRVADKYLRKQGASVATLKNPKWVTECPDTIAAAVLDW